MSDLVSIFFEFFWHFLYFMDTRSGLLDQLRPIFLLEVQRSLNTFPILHGRDGGGQNMQLLFQCFLP